MDIPMGNGDTIQMNRAHRRNFKKFMKQMGRSATLDRASLDIIGKKVMIAAPARDHDWVNHAVVTFATIAASIPPDNERIFSVVSDLTHTARNKIFGQAYESNVDYLICMDSDTVLISGPDPLVPYLIKQSQKYDAEMISGISLCAATGGKNRIAPAVFKGEGDEVANVDSWPAAMTMVDAVGGAFFFLTKKLIQSFSPENRKEFGLPFAFMKDSKGAEMSEDISFCRRVRRNGFKIWVDPSIKLGHQKSIVWTRESWEERKDKPWKVNGVERW